MIVVGLNADWHPDDGAGTHRLGTNGLPMQHTSWTEGDESRTHGLFPHDTTPGVALPEIPASAPPLSCIVEVAPPVPLDVVPPALSMTPPVAPPVLEAPPVAIAPPVAVVPPFAIVPPVPGSITESARYNASRELLPHAAETNAANATKTMT